jgi:uncharacterized glyoxalase superfamily metalloenzyme YdcJ
MSQTRIDHIVREFVRSEYFQNWQSENLAACGYSRNSDRRDRYARCQDAASDGADGSTHAEVIDDMREAFSDWLKDRRRQSRLKFAAYYYRIEAAAEKHFDQLESWHANNGSLEQQIG